MQFLDTEKVTSGAIVKEGPFYGKFTRFLVRLDGKLNDPRYAFMFRPKKYIQSISINDLLTKILGADGSAQVTILDLSGVPFDIVNTIVSLLARIIFDFNFWKPKVRRQLYGGQSTPVGSVGDDSLAVQQLCSPAFDQSA
jgi:hypothetical protein